MKPLKLMLSVLCASLLAGQVIGQDEKKDNDNDTPPAKKKRGGFGFGGGRMGGFGGGGLYWLFENADVKSTLKITDDEATLLKALQEAAGKERDEASKKMEDDNLERGERFQKMRELGEKQQTDAEKGITEIIGKDRYLRVKQINLQAIGIGGALMMPDTEKALEVTDEQKQSLREARQEIGQAMFSNLTPGERPDPEKMKEQMAEMRKKTEEAVNGILTDTQKAKWKELIGELITFKIEPPSMFGRGAGGGRPRKDA